MTTQTNIDTQKRKLIGHICAATAIVLQICFSICKNSSSFYWSTGNSLLGGALLMFALAGYLLAAWLYSTSKGRSAFWLVLGFMGPAGLLMILFGPDFSAEHRCLESRRRSAEAARLAGLPTKMK
jgi:hypothetical protein